jgi:hypothetical protein
MKTPLLLDSPEKRFQKEVDTIVAGGTDYVDAVISWCEKNNIEVEFAATLIRSNSAFKSKMLDAAKQLNFIQKKADK